MYRIVLNETSYYGAGCRSVIAEEVRKRGFRKALLVTDKDLIRFGVAEKIGRVLADAGIPYEIYSEIKANPTIRNVQQGVEAFKRSGADFMVALGGGSPMDAAKIMWVLYEHPEADFQDLAMRFMDIRKRVYSFPRMGDKAMFVAVPTTAGTGSEVTPFAVITDERTGMKYPLADYELMPDVAVIDAELMMNIPKGLTSCAGIDSLSHALEAVASVMASDFTNGIAKEAIRLIFEYLPDAYTLGAAAPLAREKMAHAASMAGMAFANAFLGVCHSMAHKLGSYWHLPHGMANSLLLEEVIRFNSADAPRKMGTFPQYAYPECKRRYADVARYIGCKGGTDDELVEELIGKMKELQRVVGQPSSIREAIGDKGTEAEFKASLEQMSEDAFDDQCTVANPRYPLISEIRKMYLNAYYGKHEPV